MKPVNTIKPSVSNIQGKKFGLKLSNDQNKIGLILSTLADKIYTNKRGAPIRETITNAQDAHIEAGKADTPLEIFVPTSLEPTVKIRDFGNGLSEEDVQNNFFALAESTKTDTNDQAGTFGYGCKSPFAYTDLYTVISIHKGVKSIYSFERASETQFEGNLISQEPTNEPSGIELAFGVSQADISAFRREIEHYTAYLPVEPVFVNGQIERKKREILFEGEGWDFVNSDENSTAIMGVIPYAMDISSVRDKLDDEDAMLLNSYGLRLYFDMGEVDIPPSREIIEMTPRTIAALRRKVKGINSDLTKQVNEKIKGSETLKEAYDVFRSVNDQISGLKLESEWNGIDVAKNNTWSDIKTPAKDGVKAELFDVKVSYFYSKYGEKLVRNNTFSPMTIEKMVNSDFAVVIDRESTNVLHRLYYLNQEEGITRFYVIKGKDADAYIEKNGGKYCVNYIDDISTVPKGVIPQNARASYGSRANVKVFEFLGKKPANRDCWGDSEEPETEQVLYVPISRFNCVQKGNWRLSYIIEEHSDLFGYEPIVYGVRKADVEKLPDHWTNFYKEYDRKVKKLVARKMHRDYIKKYELSNTDIWDKLQNIRNFVNTASSLPIEGPFSEVLKVYNKCVKPKKCNHDEIEKILQVRSSLTDEKFDNPFKDMVEKTVKSFEDQSFLLEQYVSERSYFSKDKVDRIIEEIVAKN